MEEGSGLFERIEPPGSTSPIERVLLVEDEPLMALTESTAIASGGYDVVVARSGEEALDIATGEADFALLIADVELGKGMDGIETAKTIASRRRIPVLFLTSCPEAEVETRFAGSGAFHYLMKCSSRRTLVAAVRKAIAMERRT